MYLRHAVRLWRHAAIFNYLNSLNICDKPQTLTNLKHRKTSNTNKPQTQTNFKHRKTSNTNKPQTQTNLKHRKTSNTDNLKHRKTSNTNKPQTQKNLKHRQTSNTEKPQTQTNLKHRQTSNTEKPQTQKNLKHRKTSKTDLVVILLTKTNCMQQSHFWEASSSSASQDIPRVLKKTKIHCLTHNSPPIVSVLSYINPVHAFPSYFSRYILILSSRLLLGLPSRLFP